MAKIIAICNFKGGVGKTTTAVTLGHGLAAQGKTVLLLDMDPQGQAASLLNIKQDDAAHEFLVSSRSGYEQLMVKTGRDNLWLIPGNMDTAKANVRDRPLSHLADRLAPAGAFDYIIIDTAPSIDDIQRRAIYASDFLLVPAAVDFLSVEGVFKLFAVVEELRNEYGWKGYLLGVLPTFYDENTRESKAVMADLEKHFSGSVLAPIHRATILRECAAAGRTIIEKDNTSRAAKEYVALVDYVVRHT